MEKATIKQRNNRYRNKWLHKRRDGNVRLRNSKIRDKYAWPPEKTDVESQLAIKELETFENDIPSAYDGLFAIGFEE